MQLTAVMIMALFHLITFVSLGPRQNDHRTKEVAATEGRAHLRPGGVHRQPCLEDHRRAAQTASSRRILKQRGASSDQSGASRNV